MQAPAAPRHETMVRDDDRDWTKEQMARAQEQAASVHRGPLKDPESGAQHPFNVVMFDCSCVRHWRPAAPVMSGCQCINHCCSLLVERYLRATRWPT